MAFLSPTDWVETQKLVSFKFSHTWISTVTWCKLELPTHSFDFGGDQAGCHLKLMDYWVFALLTHVLRESWVTENVQADGVSWRIQVTCDRLGEFAESRRKFFKS